MILGVFLFLSLVCLGLYFPEKSTANLTHSVCIIHTKDVFFIKKKKRKTNWGKINVLRKLLLRTILFFVFSQEKVIWRTPFLDIFYGSSDIAWCWRCWWAIKTKYSICEIYLFIPWRPGGMYFTILKCQSSILHPSMTAQQCAVAHFSRNVCLSRLMVRLMVSVYFK